MKNSAKFSPKEEKRMKKYHFQENEKDFGSTVRLDAINDKVKEIKKKVKQTSWGTQTNF